MTSDRTGLLIIRAWIEPSSLEPLRANVRLSTDISTGIERTVTLTRPEAVGALVQEWVADVLREADVDGRGDVSAEGDPAPRPPSRSHTGL